jgi:1,4-alpha-glucan branching enzyme
MGPEIGQWREWNAAGQLDWYLLESKRNAQIQNFFRKANRFYKQTSELWERDFSNEGFEWLVPDDKHNNVAVFLRRDARGHDLLCAVNFSPNEYPDYRVGVPAHRRYRQLFNTDAEEFGGEGFGNPLPVETEEIPSHGRDYSVSLRIPAFGGIFLRGTGKPLKKKSEDLRRNARKTENK